MKILIVIVAIIITISINIISKLIVKPRENDAPISRRGEQLRKFNHESIVKQRLDDYIVGNMKYEKRNKLKLLLLQSGFNLTIVDLYIISAVVAVGGFISVGMLTNNIIAGIVMFGLGLMLPSQVITFVANRRMMKLDSQVAAFIRMTVKRYYVTTNLASSIEMTLDDFQGQEPITTEIKKTIADLKVGTTAIDALEQMYERSKNKYLKLFVANLKVASNIGTEEMKQTLLDSVVEKFDGDIKMKSKLKKEINSPVIEGFLMMTIVPATYIMQASFDETYVPFMREHSLGKMAFAAAILLVALSGWLLINKVGAPLDKEEK